MNQVQEQQDVEHVKRKKQMLKYQKE